MRGTEEYESLTGDRVINLGYFSSVMEQSTSIQWAVAILYVVLLLGVLYALAADRNSLFQAIAMVAVALGIVMSVLQLRRQRSEQYTKTRQQTSLTDLLDMIPSVDEVRTR